ncbi:MAG: crossover junction endodeoxyribonuclease RuvC [Anaerolineaceae bacterium]|jgi:crossover junction endodeoxyribonuclease RuvC
MIVLGIDPGTARTGYGLVQETAAGELAMVACGVIETPAGMPAEQRLLQLYDGINQLIHLHPPDCGAVEKLFFQRNVTTAIAVGQARGVVMLALAQAGIAVAEYNPMDVKQAVVGYGSADKNQVQQMVRALLNLEQIPKPDDAADALAVAICHVHTSRIGSLYEQERDE